VNRRPARPPGRPDEQPGQHYLVHPRALAGGGDLRHVTEFLRASGWKDRSAGGGPLVLDSPDRTLRVTYNPTGKPGGWAIQGAARNGQAAWWAVLGQQTPVEIVASLTDALTRPRPAHAPNPWAPLGQQSWRARYEGEHYTATSPDNTAWMQLHRTPGGTPVWLSGARDETGFGWSAQFSATTPMHLIQNVAAALADPTPVMRPRGRVPHSARIRTTSVSVTPGQLRAWQQTRINAARAAAWTRWTPPPQAAPAPAPAHRPAGPVPACEPRGPGRRPPRQRTPP
jgi:hypothetical protein